MAQLIVFLALLFSIVIAIFAVQNTTSVAVSFLVFGPLTVAVAVLVLISAALGALAILLLGIAREVRLRLRQRSLAQQLRQAQARIAELEATRPTTAALATVELPVESSAAPTRETTA
ncbi:MAG: lipopolysaccharide assembly protein LapA domain-containing protein [Chloroflexota bacterium]|nr:lipopolysaccharide assembly protein LapA domain-containing protein [Chloroflexota bacterium]